MLEEAARLLYREWFVHFRFPSHEHVKIINGMPRGGSGGILEMLLLRSMVTLIQHLMRKLVLSSFGERT